MIKYYAIAAKKGCWGNVNRHQDSLVARVENAKSRDKAIAAFRKTSASRSEYEGEFQAVCPSALSKQQKDWIENYAEEVISA